MSFINKKYIYLIPLLAIVVFSAFRKKNLNHPEKIQWNTHFKAKPDKYSPYAAITATTWQYSYITQIRGNKIHIDFNFIGGVVPEKSWVNNKRIKDKKVSKELLNHEQGHVYINYLLLKKGEDVIRNQKYNTSNYKKLIKHTADKESKKYSDLQARYDDETNHGSNLIAQKKWDIFFKAELKNHID